MIFINKCKDKDVACSNCGSNEKLFNFHINSQISDISFYLCRNCLNELDLYLSTKKQEINND